MFLEALRDSVAQNLMAQLKIVGLCRSIQNGRNGFHLERINGQYRAGGSVFLKTIDLTFVSRAVKFDD